MSEIATTPLEARLKVLRQELNVLYELRKPHKQAHANIKHREHQDILAWKKWAKAKGYEVD